MIYKYRKGMGNNPASVDISTGVVYLNPEMWQQLNDYEKAIILLHEEGHYLNKTLDEVRADIYMINKYLADADTPQKRQELIRTIFKIVPDDRRKVEFVKNLFQYDAAGGNKRSARMVQAIEEYGEANFVAETVAIVNAAVELTNIGLQIWAAEKDKKNYWNNFSKERKREIIEMGARTAISNRFLKSGGNFSSLLVAARKPPSDPQSLWYDAFLIIAAGVRFRPEEFNNAQQISAESASMIWWGKQGYNLNTWMVAKCNEMKKQLKTEWENLSFFEKVKYSNTYKLYVGLFLVACIVVWKM